jgi:AcrR family transcriptional regulator
MSSSEADSGGRAAQRQRTRDALVAAARQLVASGATPTVEDAAAAASVSRATAYRYFPNGRALLLAAHPEMTATTMLPESPPRRLADRLDAVVTAFTTMIVDTELQQRTMLRLSLEPDPGHRGPLPLRQGRAIGWIHEAIDDLTGRLTDDEVHRVVLAVRATIGIEALVWLTDIAGLSREQATELMRWSARAILERAIRQPPPT